MTGSLSLILKKYSVPALFTIIGLVMVILGIQSQQNAQYQIATIMMFCAGVLSFLYSSGNISSKVLTILGVVAGIASIVALGLSYKSVASTQAHIKKYEKTVLEAENNLRDIRTAQKAFAEKNGRYAKDWAELKDFILNGQVPFVVQEGVVPSRKITEQERNFLYGDNRAIDNNMSELEAYRLSKMPNPPADLMGFKRDTVMVSFSSTKFDSKSYKTGRQKAGLPPFDVDALPFIPNAGGRKWKMETKDSVQIGDEFFPAIRVWGKLPIARIEGEEPEEMSFGKLTTNDTGGSWEQ